MNTPQPHILFKDDLKAGPSLVDDIETLDRTCFPWPWKEGEVKALMDKASSFFILIRLNHSSVGFMVGEINSDLCQFHLYKILVKPDFRSRGLAGVLMSEAVNQLCQYGVKEIYLEVQSTNLPAIKLYEGFGLKVIHHKKGFYSDGSSANIMLGAI